MFLRRAEGGRRCKNPPQALLQSCAFARAALEAAVTCMGIARCISAPATDGIHLSVVPCNSTTMHRRPPSCNTDCHLSVDVIHFIITAPPPPEPHTHCIEGVHFFAVLPAQCSAHQSQASLSVLIRMGQ